MTKNQIRAYRVQHKLKGHTNKEVVEHARQHHPELFTGHDDLNIIVVGELQHFATKLSRQLVIEAGNTHTELSEPTPVLVDEIGRTLADPQIINGLETDREFAVAFVAMISTYISRTQAFDTAQKGGKNTIIFSVFKANEVGGFQTRIAGITNITDLVAEQEIAADLVMAANPLYGKDTYAPSSRFHTLNHPSKTV